MIEALLRTWTTTTRTRNVFPGDTQRRLGQLHVVILKDNMFRFMRTSALRGLLRISWVGMDSVLLIMEILHRLIDFILMFVELCKVGINSTKLGIKPNRIKSLPSS